MIKVITYGTYDCLHYGHIKLLERARELGDYLIVGVTSDDYDRSRGKINVSQTLTERVEAIRATGLADQIIVEEYEGQKIDDIIKYDIDIFTVGSDWNGYFDYLKEYCKVLYLERTQGVSSTELRSDEKLVKIGLVGDAEDNIFNKYYNEFSYVDGASIVGICTNNSAIKDGFGSSSCYVTNQYEDLLKICDAIYIVSHPELHYEQVKQALEGGKHVLCESPVALKKEQCMELFNYAEQKGLILMDAIKTAYSVAFNRLLLLVKSGKIGKVVSVEATCTSIRNYETNCDKMTAAWNSICAWGPTALLPIFKVFGIQNYTSCIQSYLIDKEAMYDAYTKIDFLFEEGVATLKVGRGVKSEGDLVISGTKGYIYVPAPWWKTDYFEMRYEKPEMNKRYFYQLEGEGIRYEIVAFINSISRGDVNTYVDRRISEEISGIIEKFYSGNINLIH